jgi:HAD superfamily hydrolase (TIGR01549 family)
VETAQALGLKVAIATNPIFPQSAQRTRLAWAGLDDLDLPVVTSYEHLHACKPDPAYFMETAELIGADPPECVMVGDDRSLDLAAADVGMRTFYVGPDPRARADWRGDLVDLAALLPRLVDA